MDLVVGNIFENRNTLAPTHPSPCRVCATSDLYQILAYIFFPPDEQERDIWIGRAPAPSE